NLVILFFDVVTGMPSRKSHLLPAAVSSLESVTGIGGAERNRKNSLTAHSGYFSIFALHQKTEGTSIESN
ncbi:hypothetical protein CG422_26700, partial [Shigella flexneri]